MKLVTNKYYTTTIGRVPPKLSLLIYNVCVNIGFSSLATTFLFLTIIFLFESPPRAEKSTFFYVALYVVVAQSPIIMK